MSISSSSLNLSGHTLQSLCFFSCPQYLGHTSHFLRLFHVRSTQGILHISYVFLYVCNTQRLSLIRPAMPNLVQCKNVLDPASSAFSLYSKRSQTCLLTAIHLFLSWYRDCSLGSFSPSIPDSLCMFIVLITDTLHIKLAVKHIFWW